MLFRSATLSDRTSEEMSELLQDGKFVEKVIAPTFRESFFKQLTETAIKGLPFNMTFQFVKKNGDLGWLHLSGTKMREENGFPVYYCIFTDETIEHQTQEQLEELINQIPNGIGIFEINKGECRLKYMNDSYYRLVNDTREERFERSKHFFINNVHPDDKPLIEKLISDVENGATEISLTFRAVSGSKDYMHLRMQIGRASWRERV